MSSLYDAGRADGAILPGMSDVEPMPTVRLADATPVPALGLGTWRMGDDSRRRTHELAALEAGIQAGFHCIGDAAVNQILEAVRACGLMIWMR